jgi:hypothetical protein
MRRAVICLLAKVRVDAIDPRNGLPEFRPVRLYEMKATERE